MNHGKTVSILVMTLYLAMGFVSMEADILPPHSLRALAQNKVASAETFFKANSPKARVEYKPSHMKTRFGPGMASSPLYIYVRYKNIPLHKVVAEQDYTSVKGTLETLGILQIDEPEFVLQLNPTSFGAFDGILTWVHVQRNVEFFETDACEQSITLIANFEKIAELNDLVPGLMVKKGYVKYFPSDDGLQPQVEGGSQGGDAFVVKKKNSTKRPSLIRRVKQWVEGL